MPNRGQRVREWVNDRIKQIAIEIRDDFGSLRYPTAKEVREALRKWLEENREDLARNLPSLKHISERLRDLNDKLPRISDLEKPWSLGVSDDHRIPDEATGAIMAVWRFSVTNGAAEPISIRTARWVSKLRWVPEAGGSPHGEVIRPETIYRFASLYSGRERQVELIKDKKGMRSGVLDAHLMLDPRLQKFARRLGILEDDAGIDFGEDFSKVAPSYKAFLYTQWALNQREMPEAIRKRDALAGRLAEFHMDEDGAGAMLEMALKVLTSDLRYRKFTVEQQDDCVERLLQAMMAVYQEGDVYSWEPLPSIREILESIAQEWFAL